MNRGLAKRTSLWNQNPNCHWCGRETNLVTEAETGTNSRAPERSLMATIDHVYHQGHPLRVFNKNFVVLACYRCNQDRMTIWWNVFAPIILPKTRRKLRVFKLHSHLDPVDIDKKIEDYWKNERIKRLDKLIVEAPDWSTTKRLMQERSSIVNQANT